MAVVGIQSPPMHNNPHIPMTVPNRGARIDPDALRAEVARRLRIMRAHVAWKRGRPLSQEGLAQLTEVTRNAAAAWEAGRSLPSLEAVHLLRIALPEWWAWAMCLTDVPPAALSDQAAADALGPAVDAARRIAGDA